MQNPMTMVKDFPNGDQIVIVTTVQKDYWKQKKDSLEWQPIKDIRYCIDNYKNLIEVTLVSQSFGPNANIQSKIKKYFASEMKEKKFIITFIDAEALAACIVKNQSDPEMQEIIKEFFPSLEGKL